jgi:hypothetical protein
MVIGDDIVMKCAVCGLFIKKPTMLSGNSIGAIQWTDGKMITPMLLDDPWLIACPHCQTLLWINELAVVGRHSSPLDCELFPNAEYYRRPSFRQLVLLLQAGTGSQEKERHARLQLWWSGNDARRRPSSKAPGLSGRETANLTELARMFDEENPADLFFKGEAMRELGRFAEAQALLERCEASNAVKTLLRLVERGETRVKVLWRGFGVPVPAEEEE